MDVWCDAVSRAGALDIKLYLDVGLAAADNDIWPEWYEGKEFRRILTRGHPGHSPGRHSRLEKGLGGPAAA